MFSENSEAGGIIHAQGLDSPQVFPEDARSDGSSLLSSASGFTAHAASPILARGLRSIPRLVTGTAQSQGCALGQHPICISRDGPEDSL